MAASQASIISRRRARHLARCSGRLLAEAIDRSPARGIDGASYRKKQVNERILATAGKAAELSLDQNPVSPFWGKFRSIWEFSRFLFRAGEEYSAPGPDQPGILLSGGNKKPFVFKSFDRFPGWNLFPWSQSAFVLLNNVKQPACPQPLPAQAREASLRTAIYTDLLCGTPTARQGFLNLTGTMPKSTICSAGLSVRPLRLKNTNF